MLSSYPLRREAAKSVCLLLRKMGVRFAADTASILTLGLLNERVASDHSDVYSKLVTVTSSTEPETTNLLCLCISREKSKQTISAVSPRKVNQWENVWGCTAIEAKSFARETIDLHMLDHRFGDASCILLSDLPSFEMFSFKGCLAMCRYIFGTAESGSEGEKEDTWWNLFRRVNIEMGHAYFEKMYSLQYELCACIAYVLYCAVLLSNSLLKSSYGQTHAYWGLLLILWSTQTCMLALVQGHMCCMHVLYVVCLVNMAHIICACKYIYTYMSFEMRTNAASPISGRVRYNNNGPKRFGDDSADRGILHLL